MSRIITIPDKGFRQAIEEVLGEYQERHITENDMNRLYMLPSSGKNISDLTGIEYAKKLSHLYLDHNNIKDIRLLSGLTWLITLNLKGNNITDISPLSGLKKLEWVNLDGNDIADFSPILALNLEAHPEHPNVFEHPHRYY